jgi:hypothetical protein
MAAQTLVSQNNGSNNDVWRLGDEDKTIFSDDVWRNTDEPAKLILEDGGVQTFNNTSKTMTEMRELMENAPEQVLSEMARRLSSQLESGGMLEIADHIMRLVERKDNGALGLGENIWSRITEERKRDEREKDRADEVSDFRQNSRLSERQLQAELEQHRRSQHTLGGVTMSGEEWSNLADAMRNDDKVKNAMTAHLMAQGMTKAQADQKVQQYADAAAAMAKPPSQRTPADKDAIDRANNDPNFRGAVNAADTVRGRGRNIEGAEVQIARNEISVSNAAITDRNILSAQSFSSQSTIAAEAGTDAPCSAIQRSTNSVAPMNVNTTPDCTASFSRACGAKTPLDSPTFEKSNEVTVAVVKTTATVAPPHSTPTSMTGGAF